MPTGKFSSIGHTGASSESKAGLRGCSWGEKSSGESCTGHFNKKHGEVSSACLREQRPEKQLAVHIRHSTGTDTQEPSATGAGTVLNSLRPFV